jgi:NTP pyrophosphatase (non-canonical NTP hydrolase)
MNIGKQVREHKKLVEELLELATVITQQLNKPKLDLEEEIIKEIGDVKWRVSQVEKYYNINKINNQIQYKNDRDRNI